MRNYEKFYEDPGAALKEVVVAQAAKDRVVFRSQVTPTFQRSLADLTAGKPQRPPQGRGVAGRVTNAIMRLVKPEVSIYVLGQNYTVAPWGRPTKDYTPAVAVGAVALAGGAWWLLRRFRC